MHIEQLPARAGWQWVLKGFALVRRQPLPILSLTFLYLMMLTAPSIIPSIGGLLPLLLTPLLAVGLVLLRREVARHCQCLLQVRERLSEPTHPHKHQPRTIHLTHTPLTLP